MQELGFMNGDPNRLLLGVTATPKRGDGIGLNEVFEEIVFERSIGTMIRAGYLSPLIGKRIITRTDLRGVGFANGDFVAGELSRAVNNPSRNNLIVDNFKEFGSGRRKAIAFCADVQHAQDLAAIFNFRGIRADSVYGAMDKDKLCKTCVIVTLYSGSFFDFVDYFFSLLQSWGCLPYS